MSQRSLVGRADLLRAAVAACGGQAAGDEEAMRAALAPFARLLDLERQPARAQPAELPASEPAAAAADSAGGKSATPGPTITADRRPPLSAAHFALVEYTVDAKETPPARDERVPLTRLDCQPRRTGRAPHAPLVGRTRLWPALQRALASPRRGPLDVPALVRELAQARSPQRMPRRVLRRWGGELHVVVDLAHRLVPYDADYRALLDEVRRRHGRGGLRLWLVDDSPFSARAVDAAGRVSSPAGGAMPLPPPATRVLILGDLGLLAAERARGEAWQHFTRRLAAHGARPIAWLPMSPALVPAEALRDRALHCLAGARGLHALRPRQASARGVPLATATAWPPGGDDPAAASPSGVAPAAARHPLLPALLSRLACCQRVEPGLLRALRRLDAEAAAEPGLEALVWSYAPVVAAGSRFCEIAPAWRGDYAAAFSRLGAAEQQDILRRVLEAHAWRGRATESAEILLWHAHARPEAAADAAFVARLGEARDWFARFSAASGTVPGDAAGYADELFHRHGGDTAWLAANSPLLAPIWALTGADDIPLGLQPADVAAALGRRGVGASPGAWRLQQQDDRFVLLPAGDAPPPGRWPTLNFAGGVFCRLRFAAGGCQRWLEPRAAPLTLPIAHAAKLHQIILLSGRRRYALARQTRPSWARELARDAHGLYLDVDFSGVVQRFRWIEPGDFWMGSPPDEPGDFWMGSPPDEPERYDDEGPRHRVRLSTGFWLADTACTQALWLTVMRGKNPSWFQDDLRNPVEHVSWDDVQGFLQRVTARLPGVAAELPSEAEWEYACRAGSETPFHFGATIGPQQANYKGNFAYDGGGKGEDRQKTVAVKSFPPNAWGLYEMHDNARQRRARLARGRKRPGNGSSESEGCAS